MEVWPIQLWSYIVVAYVPTWELPLASACELAFASALYLGDAPFVDFYFRKNLYSYGLNSYGLYNHGLCNYGL